VIKEMLSPVSCSKAPHLHGSDGENLGRRHATRREIPSGSVGHHVNILHVFCTSGRSMFMPRSAANAPFGISAEMTKELIYWAFRWWAL
jgi:hypothetical protein